MYIGSTDDGSGLHRMIFEVVANAVNEALDGHADLIEITLNADGSVTVSDNGRGLPVDIDEDEWLSVAELIMTRLLHGIGVCVVNALSEMLELRIWRDDAEWFMRFRHGVAEAGLDRIGPAKGRTGTEIKFKPSPDIFTQVDFDCPTIESRAQEFGSLRAGFRIVWADNRA